MEMMQAICELDPKAGVTTSMVNDWYVDASIEIGDGVTLKTVSGRGQTPDGAVRSWWSEATGISPEKYLVIDAMGPGRTHFRWSGHMWKRVGP